VRVVRTEQAERDLVEIWDWISQWDEGAADRTLAALERKTRLLEQHSTIGRLRKDIAEDARSTVCEPYLILYRLLPDRVEVVRYVHMRRRLEGLM
jgi:toxin ParE1/3/4